MNMDPCSSALHPLLAFHTHQEDCSTRKTSFYKGKTNTIQTYSRFVLFIFLLGMREWAKTGVWHTTHCAEEHAVQAAARHAGAGGEDEPNSIEMDHE